MERLHLYAKTILVLALAVWVNRANAQDPVFSQFNLNKNYLNPAYAGYTEDISVGINTRRQWTNVPGGYTTNTFNVNAGCAEGKVGFALMGYDHTEGEGHLNTQSATFQMSVNFPGKLPRWMGRNLYRNKIISSGGLSVGVGQKTIDWSKLTFSDQFSPYEGYLNQPSVASGYAETSNMIFDVSAGFRTQAQINRKGSYVSLGAAAFHLNQPVETFFGSDNKLPTRYTFHFFTYFQLKKFVNKPSYLSIGMISDNQANLRSNTLMVAKDIQNYAKLNVGFRRQNFLLIDKNVDAIIIQGLVSFNGFTIGYSYDVTVSNLGPHRTYGTHEVGLAYAFPVGICRGKGRGKGKKSHDNCFMLMDDINSNFKDLYLWNP